MEVEENQEEIKETLPTFSTVGYYFKQRQGGMNYDMKFVKSGTYWGLPLYRKVLLNIKYWVKGTWMFLKVISNYEESVVQNELDILSAWGLCHSLQEPKMGKMYRITDFMTKEDTP